MESISVASVLQKNYAELVDILGKNLNDVLVYLVSEGVIKIEEKNTIMEFVGKTPSQRAQYLLDNHVDRPLSGGLTDNFLKLLKCMQKIPGCSNLAAEISKAIKCDTPKISDEASKIDQSGMGMHIRFKTRRAPVFDISFVRKVSMAMSCLLVCVSAPGYRRVRKPAKTIETTRPPL